jgi:hypothetical protein
LDRDLLNLIETRELRPETLKELKVKKPGISNRPGIYVHIIYNPDDLNVVGIYVGSAKWLVARIKIHKMEQKKVNRRQERRDVNERRRLAHRPCIRGSGPERGIGILALLRRVRPAPKCDREAQPGGET